MKEYFKQRGLAIYHIRPRRDPEYLASCSSHEETAKVVRALNDLAEIVNTGLSVDDVTSKVDFTGMNFSGK